MKRYDAVVEGVKPTNDLGASLGDSFDLFLEHINEAILVLDGQRRLVYVNSRAKRLLDYDEGHTLSNARCKLTTRGDDCEQSCPLTFAFETDLDSVRDFETVYRTQRGHPVPLRVTIIPLRDKNGGPAGAIEILRPTTPDFGIILAGGGKLTRNLRQRLRTAAVESERVVLVGDLSLCRDIAKTYHRFAELPEELFVEYTSPEVMARGSWPPGTIYAEWSDHNAWFPDEVPAGWRLVIAGPSEESFADAPMSDSCQISVPTPAELSDDLPMILAAMARSLDPDLKLAPDAIQRLSHFAVENGFERTRRLICAAAEGADGPIDADQLPLEGYGICLIDEILKEDDPLRASEARLITEVLCRCGWRMQDAADRLGMSRVTLWRKLREHGIEREQTS